MLLITEEHHRSDSLGNALGWRLISEGFLGRAVLEGHSTGQRSWTAVHLLWRPQLTLRGALELGDSSVMLGTGAVPLYPHVH